MPKISVVLPTYNGEKYIKESIDSILNQSYTDFELIVVNDCSTDATPQIIEEYAATDARVRVIHNKTNKKLPASLNVGFSQAMGEYYTWTSDDNRYGKTALEEMACQLDQHKEVGLIYCDCVEIDGNGNEKGKKDWGSTEDIYLGNCVGACFMYRKRIADKIGGYDTSMFLAEDYDYWLRIYLESEIMYYPVSLYYYRMHENSLTSTRQQEVKHQTARLWMKYRKQLVAKMKKYEEKKLFFDNILYYAKEEEKKQILKKLNRMSLRYFLVGIERKIAKQA